MYYLTMKDLNKYKTITEVIEKSGTWFSYGNIRLGQGRENTKQFINQKPELLQEIEQVIIKKLATAK